jgi:hypothetical protein
MSDETKVATVTAEEQALNEAKQVMRDIAATVIVAMAVAETNQGLLDVLTHALFAMYQRGGRDAKVIMAEQLAGVPGQVTH